MTLHSNERLIKIKFLIVLFLTRIELNDKRNAIKTKDMIKRRNN
jgi:hypothetical protein